jgi:hypothetical protein
MRFELIGEGYIRIRTPHERLTCYSLVVTTKRGRCRDLSGIRTIEEQAAAVFDGRTNQMGYIMLSAFEYNSLDTYRLLARPDTRPDGCNF